MGRQTAVGAQPESEADQDLVALFGEARLESAGAHPLYAQLEQLLRSRIRDQLLTPGDRLPTEKELQRYFRVSRVTVRQALENLVRDGLISRRRGRGTEVNPPKIEVTLDGMQGFTEAMEARGFTVRTQLLCQEEMPATDEMAHALNLVTGEVIWHLERVRYVNDERIVHVHSYLPGLAMPGDGTQLRGSLYQYLQHRNLSPMATEECLEAVQADATLASRLGVPPGAPLLRRVRHSNLEDGRRIEYTVGHYRGDRYRYRFHLRGA